MIGDQKIQSIPCLIPLPQKGIQGDFDGMRTDHASDRGPRPFFILTQVRHPFSKRKACKEDRAV